MLARAGFDAVGAVAGALHDRTGLGGPAASGILLYHGIGGPDQGHFGTVSRRRFRADLARFTDAFEFVDLETLAAADGGGRLALTFDDGLRSVRTRALPVLREFDVPATVFLNPGFLGDGDPGVAARRHAVEPGDLDLLDDEGVCALADDPLVTIGNHTLTHANLAALEDPGALHREVVAARERLEDRYGVDATAFSYPYGAVTGRARRLVRDTHGVSVTTGHRTVDAPTDPHDLPRFHAHRPYRRLRWELTTVGGALHGLRHTRD